MTGTDHVMLFDDPDFRIRTDVLPWPHVWPPWEHLTLVVGKASGERAMVNEIGLEELRGLGRERGWDIEEMYHMTAYTRETYSELPEDVATDPDSRLFRAARYLRDRTDT